MSIVYKSLKKYMTAHEEQPEQRGFKKDFWISVPILVSILTLPFTFSYNVVLRLPQLDSPNGNFAADQSMHLL